MDEKRRQMLDDVFGAFTIAPDGNHVAVLDVPSATVRWAPAAVDLFGLSGEYVESGASDWASRVHPDDRRAFEAGLAALTSCERLSLDVTYRVRTADGSYAQIRNRASVLRDASGRADFVVSSIVNQGLMENTDPLTVLRNERSFRDDLSREVAQKSSCTAMVVGFNRLDHINATYGYAYGNRVLQQVAWLIQDAAMGSRVYRLNGSKFAVLVEGGVSAAREVYADIRRRIASLRVDEVRHGFATSAASIDLSAGSHSEQSLYSCLMFAYRESEERQHGDLVCFEGRKDRSAVGIIDAARACVANGCRDFDLHYQPIYETVTQRVIGAEALVRWHDDVLGDVPPLAFLPVLEQDPLFDVLADWILQHALSDGLAFLQRRPDFLLDVNVSGVRLDDDYFADTIMQALDRAGFPPSNLRLGLTKGCRLLDLGHLVDTMERLHSSGVKIVVDNFGAGFASAEVLQLMPVDAVKLDRVFFAREDAPGIRLRNAGAAESALARDARAARILRHLAGLAGAYGARVCVTGVETEAARAALVGCPIEEVQGNMFAKPMPFEDLLAML